MGGVSWHVKYIVFSCGCYPPAITAVLSFPYAFANLWTRSHLRLGACRRRSGRIKVAFHRPTWGARKGHFYDFPWFHQKFIRLASHAAQGKKILASSYPLWISDHCVVLAKLLNGINGLCPSFNSSRILFIIMIFLVNWNQFLQVTEMKIMLIHKLSYVLNLYKIEKFVISSHRGWKVTDIFNPTTDEI